MNRSVLLAWLMFFPLAVGPAFGGELEERAGIKTQVRSLFFEESFADLESLAERFRNNEERTSSGLWKLTMFYYGLSDAVNTQIKDERFWEEVKAKVNRWENIFPNSPTANIAKSIVLNNYAWKFRGGGYASSVRPESWAPFHANLEVANDFMLSVEHQASVDPHWYEIRAQILSAQGAGIREFSAFVEEGLDRFPNYYQLYFASVSYLAPKWHGNKKLIEEFAIKSAERTKGTEGMGLYARIYWYASQTQYDRSLFSSSAVVWRNMRNGIEDVIEQYPDQWNIQNFALFSCLADDPKMTRRLMAMMDGNPIGSVWRDAQTLEHCAAL